MKIKLTKIKHYYRADCLDVPGTPPIGIGNKKHEAMANLFLNLIYSDLTKYIKCDTLEFEYENL